MAYIAKEQILSFAVANTLIILGSIIGTVLSAVSLGYDYAGKSDATPEGIKAAEIAGFNDPVIGALLASTMVATLYCCYTVNKFSPGIGVSSVEKRDFAKSIAWVNALASMLPLYAIVAGALSVTDHGALSSGMIGPHDSTGEIAGYFVGYTLFLAIALGSLHLVRKLYLNTFNTGNVHNKTVLKPNPQYPGNNN